MMKYNKELVKAGVQIIAKGLHPSLNGVHLLHLNDEKNLVVTDGSYTETNELIAGFILIDIKCNEEAIDWAWRIPDH